jgi:hypothetical protein
MWDIFKVLTNSFGTFDSVDAEAFRQRFPHSKADREK